MARVEIFRRQPENVWLLSECVGLEAACHFHSIDCRGQLAEIYDKVVFEDASGEMVDREGFEPS
jgi:hypothetical protein